MDGYYWKLRRAMKYSPDQPRVPKGDPRGGQWTSSGGGGPTISMLVDDPKLEEAVRWGFNRPNRDGSWVVSRIEPLRDVPIQEERVIATIEDKETEETWEVYIFQTAGVMRTVHKQSPMSLQFKNTTPYRPSRETVEWMLDRGSISLEEAREDYGYEP